MPPTYQNYYQPEIRLTDQASDILENILTCLNQFQSEDVVLVDVIMDAFETLLNEIDKYIPRNHFGFKSYPHDYQTLVKRVIDYVSQCDKIPPLIKMIIFYKLHSISNTPARDIIFPWVLYNLENVVVDADFNDKYMNIINDYNKTVLPLCTTIINGEYYHADTMITAVNIQYAFQADKSKVNWETAWKAKKRNDSKLFDHATIRSTQSFLNIPQLPFEEVVTHLTNHSYTLDYIREILSRYKHSKDSFQSLVRKRFHKSSVVLHDLILTKLVSKTVLPSLRQLLDDIFEICEVENGVLDPIFSQVVNGIGIRCSGLKDVMDTFINNLTYKNCIVKYILLLNFENRSVIEQLYALDCLDYNDLTRVYLIHEKPTMIPSLYKKCNKLNRYNLLFQYIWKCATSANNIKSYLGHNVHPAIFFLFLLKRFNCHNILSNGNEELIQNYVETSNLYQFRQSSLRESMEIFIKLIYPLTNTDDDQLNENSVYCLALEKICAQIVKPNLIFKIDWFSDGLPSNSHPSHSLLANIILTPFCRSEVIEQRPVLYNIGLILNNEMVNSYSKKQFTAFHQRITGKEYSYDGWQLISSDLELFRYLGMICNITITEQERQEMSFEYQTCFKKLEDFSNIFKTLVHHFNVKAGEELKSIDDSNANRNTLPLKSLLKSVKDSETILQPILGLNIGDLKIFLSSRLLLNEIGKQASVSIGNSPRLINHAVQSIKDKLKNNNTKLSDLKIDTLIAVPTFSKDLAREKAFLKQIGLEDNLNIFENACHLYYNIQLLRDLKELEISELQTGAAASLFNLDASKILYKDAKTVMDSIVRTTGVDENMRFSTIFTWNIFSYVVKCKDLLDLCKKQKYRPDEGRKQIILQKLNEFQASIFHNYWECLTFLTPFIQLHDNQISIQQFFQLISTIDIKNEESLKLYECLTICNDEMMIEEIREIFEKASRLEESMEEVTKQLSLTGTFRVMIDKQTFVINYFDAKNREHSMDEQEFRDLLNNALFKCDSLPGLKMFSETCSLIVGVYDAFIKLHHTGHIAFQDQTIDIPLNIKSSKLSNFLSKILVIEKDWNEQVVSVYNGCRDLVSFSSRQLVFLSHAISKKDFTNLQFTQLIHSCFGDIEIPQNNEDTNIPQLIFNWEGFETTRQNIKDYTHSVFESVKSYISKINQIQNSKPLERINSTIGCRDFFHDISTLKKGTQLNYLLSLSTHSNDILYCTELTTDTDVRNKIALHEKMLSGRVVIHGIEMLTSSSRSILVKYLMSIRNTDSKQIICTIMDSNIKNLLPSFTIHQIQEDSYTTIDTTNTLKFNEILYFDHAVGSGKTNSIEQLLKNFVIVDLHSRSTVDSIITQLEEHVHTNDDGSLYFNISHDASIEFVNKIFFEIICLGCCKSNDKVLYIPKKCKENWTIYVEIPHLIRNENQIVNMSTELHSITTFGRRGTLAQFSLSKEYEEMIDFLQQELTNGKTQTAHQYLTATLLPNKCKNIRTENDGNYSYRTLSLFLSFMYQKYSMLLVHPHYTTYNSGEDGIKIGSVFTVPFINLFLMEVDNFFKSQQDGGANDGLTGIYSIPAHGNISIVPFDGKKHIPDDIEGEFDGLLNFITQNLHSSTKDYFVNDTFVDPELMNIDYQLVGYLASSLNVPDSMVTSVIDKYKYILIPEYLHKMIEINTRNRMKIPIIIEGDSGTGKTKMVNVYSEIMTANHCNPMTCLWELIKQKDNNFKDYIYGCDTKKVQELDQILNSPDRQKVFDIIVEMFTQLNDNLKKSVCEKIVKFSTDLILPIMDNLSKTQNDAEFKKARQEIDNIGNVDIPLDTVIATIVNIVKYCSEAGRSYLSTIITHKYESFVKDLLENEIAHIDGKDLFITRINENLHNKSLVEFILEVLQNDSVKDKLNTDLKNCMNLFIDEHPMLKVDETLLNQLKDANQVVNSDILFQFLTLSRHSPFLSVLMNAQLSAQDLFDKMKDFIELAEKTEKHKHKCSKCGGCAQLMCLIDESNTTSIMGKLSTLLIDHRLSEYSTTSKLPSNLTFVCAINPHGGDGKFLVREETLSMKPFKFWWDQLNKEQLEKYINYKIINTPALYKLNMTKSRIDTITKLLMNCHFEILDIIKKKQMRSTVSQRDIQRLFQIFEWCYIRNEPIPGINMNDRILYSFLIAIAFCYYFRLYDEDKNTFIEKINLWALQICGQVDLNFSSILQKTMDYFVNDFELPSSIFKNGALTQNLFSLLICIENRIPLILIGDPGCSKTLSLLIIRWNMGRTGSILKKFNIIDTVHRYQGSKQSTSEQVGIVCEKAKQNQLFFDSKQLKKLALFHFDEAGVTDSKKESLKILHYYLNDNLFPAVLITNEPLDVAKSNRCIESVLSKPNEEDLTQLAEGIIKRYKTDEITQETRRILQSCCAVFSEISSNTLISHWIGMRDFYHKIRYLRRKQTPGQLMSISPTMLLHALERNINGVEEHVFRESIVKKFFNRLGPILPAYQTIPNYRLNLEILKDSLSDNNRGTDKDNLNDTCVRFKLIVDETMNDSLPSILKQIGILKNVEELSLSEFKKDEQSDIHKITVLSKLVAAMETGKTILLTNTRALDSSCYDLFNQYYQVTKSYEKNGADEFIYFTSIAIGAVSEYRKVHPDFQCIVVVRKSQVASLEHALLNRFEKFTISMQDLLLYKRKHLSASLNEQVTYLIKKSKSFIDHISYNNDPNNCIYTCNIDATIESIILNMITEDGKIQCPLSIDEKNGKEAIQLNLKYIITKILQITRVESMMLNRKLIPQMYSDLYFDTQCHFSLKQFVDKELNNLDKNITPNKYMIYSPIGSITPDLPSAYILNLDEIDSQTTFINHLQQFNSDNKMKVFALGVNESLLSSHVSHQVRNIIDQHAIKGKMYLVLNSFRQDKFSLGVPALFVSGWEHYYIDTNSDEQLVEYIKSVRSDVPLGVEKKSGDWEILKALIPKALGGLKSDSSYINHAIYDSKKSIETRSAPIIDMMEKLPSLQKVMLEIASQVDERSFREKEIQSICQSILRNEIYMNLSEHIKNSSEKAFLAIIERVLFLLLDKCTVISLIDLSDSDANNDSLEKLLRFFVSAKHIGSIDEILLRRGNNYLTSGPNQSPSLPFSHSIISTLSDSIMNYNSKLTNEKRKKLQLGLKEEEVEIVVPTVLPLILNEETTELFAHIESHSELYGLLVQDLIKLYYANHTIIYNQQVLTIVRHLLVSLIEINDAKLSVLSVISQLEHQKNDTLIEDTLCSIQPLINLQIIDQNTLLNELIERLQSNFCSDHTTSIINRWIMETSTEYVSSLLTRKGSWKEFSDWCLCFSIISKYQKKNNQTVEQLCLLNVLREIVLVLAQGDDQNLTQVEHEKLKRLTTGDACCLDDVVKVLDYVFSEIAIFTTKEQHNGLLKSIVVELIPLAATHNEYLEFILQIINSTHDLNKFSSLSIEMSVFIMKQLLALNLEESILQYTNNKVIQQNDMTEYQPPFFNRVNNSVNCNICDCLYTIEMKKLEQVMDLNGIIVRLGENANNIKSRITVSCLQCKFIELAVPLLEQLEQEHARVLSTILKSNTNYQLLFMKYLKNRYSLIEFTSLVNSSDNLFQQLGLQDFSSKIKPTTISTSFFPFIYEKSHDLYNLYQQFKSKIMNYNKVDIEQFIDANIKTDAKLLYYFRMFLVCIGYLEYFKKGITNNIPFNTDLQLLQLNDKEIVILNYLFKNPNYNNSCIQQSLKGKDLAIDNLFNCVAFVFGVPKNTYFYNLLFDIDKLYQTRIVGEPYGFAVKGTADHRGYIDCGTQMDQYGVLVHQSNLGIVSVYMLYFITFGLMSLQVEFFDQSFDMFYDHVFSLAADNEGMGSKQENVKSMAISRCNGNWLHLISKSTLSIDQCQMLLVKCLQQLQHSTLENSPLLNLSSVTADHVKQFETLYTDIFKECNQQEKLSLEKVNADHDECIESIEEFKLPSPKYDYLTQFFNDASYSNLYPVLSLYLKNKNRMRFSKILCLLNELYVWIHVNFNGLISVEDVSKPLRDIIKRYHSKSKVDSMLKMHTEVVTLWNEYISEFGGFDFECGQQGKGIVEKIDVNMSFSYILSFSDQDFKSLTESNVMLNDKNIIYEAMKTLAKTHNHIHGPYAEYMQKLGYNTVLNGRHLFTLNANNASHFMFQAMNDDSVILSQVDQNGKFDWSSVQNCVVNHSMLYVPKIDLPKSPIYFKLRFDNEMEKRDSEYLEFSKSIPQELRCDIDSDSLLQIQHQHHDLPKEQILEIIDELVAVSASSVNNADAKLGDLLRKCEKSVGDLKVNQIGTLLDIFVTNLTNMYYIYRLIPYNYKKEFTGEELENLKTTMTAQNLPNKELYDILVEYRKTLLSFEQYLDDITDTIYQYYVDIYMDIEVEVDPLCKMFGHIKPEHYVSLIRFIQQEINQLLDKQQDEQQVQEQQQTVWQHDEDERVLYVEIPVPETPWYSKDVDDSDSEVTEEEHDDEAAILAQQENVLRKVQSLLEELNREEQIGQTLMTQIASNNQYLIRLVNLLNEKDELTRQNDILLNAIADNQIKISLHYSQLNQQQ